VTARAANRDGCEQWEDIAACQSVRRAACPGFRTFPSPYSRPREAEVGGGVSAEVGPQGLADDVGFVDAFVIGTLREQVSEVVVEPGVDGG